MASRSFRKQTTTLHKLLFTQILIATHVYTYTVAPQCQSFVTLCSLSNYLLLKIMTYPIFTYILTSKSTNTQSIKTTANAYFAYTLMIACVM